MTGNPVAIITGASGGMAPGIAQVLCNKGYALVLVARNMVGLRKAADKLGGSTRVEAISCDVTDTASVNTMVAKAVEQFGRIDLLVNAAASSNPIGGSIEQVDVDALVADTDTKVGGYLRCIQAVVPIMKARGLGCIINVGGLTGRSSDTLSGLRNVAVTHLTKVLADQLGPFGLTVNAVHPGLTRTPHLDELFVDMAAEKAVSPHEIEAEFVSQIPTRRLSMPQEVGEAIAFLASAHGGSINGESIAIDGGYSRGIYL